MAAAGAGVGTFCAKRKPSASQLSSTPTWFYKVQSASSAKRRGPARGPDTRRTARDGTETRGSGSLQCGVCCEKKLDFRHQTSLAQSSVLLYDKFVSTALLQGPFSLKSKIFCHIIEKTILISLFDVASQLFFHNRLQYIHNLNTGLVWAANYFGKTRHTYSNTAVPNYIVLQNGNAFHSFLLVQFFSQTCLVQTAAVGWVPGAHFANLHFVDPAKNCANSCRNCGTDCIVAAKIETVAYLLQQ